MQYDIYFWSGLIMVILSGAFVIFVIYKAIKFNDKRFNNRKFLFNKYVKEKKIKEWLKNAIRRSYLAIKELKNKSNGKL